MKKKKTEIITGKTDTGYMMSKNEIEAVRKIQNVASALMETQQEILFSVEEILRHEFHFTDKDLKHLRDTLEQMMRTLAYYDEKGVMRLSLPDIQYLARRAETKLIQMEAEQSGIALPTKEQTKKLS